MNSVADERVAEREEAECPVCSGVALEPRSGEKWLCRTCARRLDGDEVVRE